MEAYFLFTKLKWPLQNVICRSKFILQETVNKEIIRKYGENLQDETNNIVLEMPLKSNLVSNQRLKSLKVPHQSVNVKRWGKAIWIGSETVVENNLNNKKVWFKNLTL